MKEGFDFYFIYLFIYLFIFGCVGSPLRCTGFSLRWPLLLRSTGSRHAGFSSCDTRAQLPRGMWDPPGPGLEPVSPASAGRFPTTAPLGKPFLDILIGIVFNLQVNMGSTDILMTVLNLLTQKCVISLRLFRLFFILSVIFCS